jgi:hypothetical protein
MRGVWPPVRRRSVGVEGPYLPLHPHPGIMDWVHLQVGFRGLQGSRISGDVVGFRLLLRDGGLMAMTRTVGVGRMMGRLPRPLPRLVWEELEVELLGHLLHNDGTIARLSGEKARRVSYWMELVRCLLSLCRDLSMRAR